MKTQPPVSEENLGSLIDAVQSVSLVINSKKTLQKHRLKEPEYLTLQILRDQGVMIVGDIQKILSVLPAQMSRIIRKLENREQPLIQCEINSTDKRKIDVELTQHGEKILTDVRERLIRVMEERMNGERIKEGDMHITTVTLQKIGAGHEESDE